MRSLFQSATSAPFFDCRIGANPPTPPAPWQPTQPFRSEEHTSELQSHRDLHSFPTRRSSDLDALLVPERNIRAFFRLQNRRQPPYATSAMAADAALLHVNLRAFLGGAATGRELVPRGTDRDIHAAELFRGRRASYAVRRRLRDRRAPREAPQQQRNRDDPRRGHW